jgi:formylglycine-generating enzyme
MQLSIHIFLGGMMRLFSTVFISIVFCSMFIFMNCSGKGSSGDTASTPIDTIPTTTYVIPGENSGNTITLNFKLTPAMTFKTGEDDSGIATVNNDFWVSESEITYELWHAVYLWATTNYNATGKRIDGGNLYTNMNAGQMGSDNLENPNTIGGNQQPVTKIGWRSAMVWCNALTEYYNAYNGTDTDLDCVFYADSNYAVPLRDATGLASADPYVKASTTGNTSITACTAKGFRLASSNEWELSARFIKDINNDGDICDSGEYYSGDAASGDTTGYCYTGGVSLSLSTIMSNYAVFRSTWNGSDWVLTNVTTTAPVRTKIKNNLGLYDMSGNIWEYCYEMDASNTGRIVRGTSFMGASRGLGRISMGSNNYTIGFRIVRSK